MPDAAPLKIVRIITRLNIGGPAQQAVALSEPGPTPGWSTLLITGNPEKDEGDMSYRMEGKGIRCLHIPELRRPLHLFRDLVAGWKILRCLLRERPQVLHTHTAKAGALGRMAGWAYQRLTGAPLKIFHTFHGHVLEGYFGKWKSRLFCAIERWLARRSTGLITVSESVRGDLESLGIAPASRIQVVHLGLPLERLLEMGPPEPSPDLRVGLIGRLVPIKNHPMLFEAVRMLQEQEQTGRIRFTLYGDGELKTSLKELARSRGISGRVEFLGWQPDVCAIYRTLDCVCLTSRNEGTPVSLIEAMAAGRPVISTAVGGVPDLLGKPLEKQPAGAGWAGGFTLCERGILLAPDDAAGLAAALRFIASEPAEGSRMAEAGRRFAGARFSVETLRCNLDALYRGQAS